MYTRSRCAHSITTDPSRCCNNAKKILSCKEKRLVVDQETHGCTTRSASSTERNPSLSRCTYAPTQQRRLREQQTHSTSVSVSTAISTCESIQYDSAAHNCWLARFPRRRACAQGQRVHECVSKPAGSNEWQRDFAATRDAYSKYAVSSAHSTAYETIYEDAEQSRIEASGVIDIVVFLNTLSRLANIVLCSTAGLLKYGKCTFDATH